MAEEGGGEGLGFLLLFLVVEDDDLASCIGLAFDLILNILPLVLLLNSISGLPCLPQLLLRHYSLHLAPALLGQIGECAIDGAVLVLEPIVVL